MTFLKKDPRPCAMLKQVFFKRLTLRWLTLVLRESPNSLEMVCFGTKNGSKMGQKHTFPNLILDHLHKRVR